MTAVQTILATSSTELLSTTSLVKLYLPILVVSFIVAVVLVLVFYLLDKLLLFMPSALAGPIQFMAVDYHLANIRRGVIDSRNLIYFGSLIWLFLTMTVRVVEMRKWR